MRGNQVDYQRHKTFWKDGDRKVRIAEVATSILKKSNHSVDDIAARMKINTNERRTLRSYLKPAHWEEERRPQLLDLLTQATQTLFELLEEDTQSVWGCDTEKRKLQSLLAEMPPGLVDKAGGRAIGRYDREHLEKIIRTIPKPSKEKNARAPEFPHLSPRFPATGAAELELGTYKLMIKDESRNPTGSHKDRWAWEKLIRYRERIEEELNSASSAAAKIAIPVLAIISAGSAAMALQSLLQLYGLPSLRVLLDSNSGRVPDELEEKLEAIGAEVRRANLDKEEISSDALFELFGCRPDFDIDVTSRDADSPFEQSYYDWLTYEILALQPDYIFVPVGSGDLFANIIRIIESETNNNKVPHDRLKNARDDLTGIHVMGAKPKIQRTRMTKLWAKFTPSHEAIEKKVDELVKKETLGAHSGIYELEDIHAMEALDKAAAIELNTEPSGIAGVGLFLKLKDQLSISASDNIVAVNTGWLNLGR